jgi:D-serine deaminase-like pyridoxal phosphate-dependent protein
VQYLTKAFEPSLFVWATVMSRPTEDRAIVDAGVKALAFLGPPLVCDKPAATYQRASDEHQSVGISGAAKGLNLATRCGSTPAISDRTAPVANLEGRMDDVRAVMDAARSQRGALFGVCV